MTKSTHKAEVIPVVLLPHDNADSLSIVPVGGYTAVVRTEEFKDKEKACFIQPDSVVDVTRPEFAFLAPKSKNGKLRIKACKLRGVLSYGLLISAPDDANIGDDLAERLGIEHYEPEASWSLQGGDNVSAPKVPFVKYDVDNIKAYMQVFQPNEPVCCSYKIHGANMRVVFHDGQQYVGSRSNWKVEHPNNTFWKAFYQHPELAVFCQANPDVVIYGECYGNQVQDMHYGKKSPHFAAFDIMKGGKFIDVRPFLDTCQQWNIPTVQIVGTDMPFDYEKFSALAELPCDWPGANHCNEGVVIRPMVERWDEKLGRVILKLVSFNYYNRKCKD